MSIGNLLKTSLYSIKAHKLRVFLTMIGIIIGISSTVTMKSIGDGLSNYIETSMQESGSNVYQAYFEFDDEYMDSGMITCFDDNDVEDIKRVEGVTKATAASNTGSSEQMYSTLSYFGKSNQGYIASYTDNYPTMEYGDWFNKSNDNKKQIVLNNETAKALFGSAKKAVGKGVTFNNDIYEVIGVTKKTNNLMDSSSYYNFVSSSNLKEATNSDYIWQVNFTIDPGYDTDEVFDKVKEVLTKNHPELEGKYEVYDPSEEIKLMSSVIGGITTFVTAITGIALFVGGVGVMNIMYVSVTERKREIGIRRAIGAKPRSILLQFLFEAIIVTGIGGIIGIVFGAILGKIIGGFIPIDGFKSIITLKTLIGSASVSVLVGVIFGIVPARNASKLDPIKAIYQ